MLKRASVLILLISLLIASLSIGYYYLIFLQKRDNELLIQSNTRNSINELTQQEQARKQSFFENSIKCQNEASKFFDTERPTYPKGDLMLDTRAVYSPDYNACIAHFYTYNPNSLPKTKFYELTNLTTGERIYYYTESRNDKNEVIVLSGNKQEYEDMMRKIFPE